MAAFAEEATRGEPIGGGFQLSESETTQFGPVKWR